MGKIATLGRGFYQVNIPWGPARSKMGLARFWWWPKEKGPRRPRNQWLHGKECSYSGPIRTCLFGSCVMYSLRLQHRSLYYRSNDIRDCLLQNQPENRERCLFADLLVGGGQLPKISHADLCHCLLARNTKA